MAMKIILVDDGPKQEKTVIDVEIHDRNWEEDCYQIGCMVAKSLGEWYLESMEEKILKERPSSLRAKDIHERTLVTRFGDITVNRRYYRDKHGTYHNLLDEYLSWRSNQVATSCHSMMSWPNGVVANHR